MFVILVVVLTILFLYIFLIREPPIPSDWDKKGIKTMDVTSAASTFEVITGRKSIMHRDNYAYSNLGSDKFCAIKESPNPVIFIKDLNLAKKILIKDFDNFVNRRDFIPVSDRENNLVGSILGLLKGSKWKRTRGAMSPGFSSGKIRGMMEHFDNISTELMEILGNQCNSGPGHVEIEVMKTVNSYVVEVIACAVFGIRPDLLRNQNSDFAQMADKLAEFGWIEALKLNFGLRFPRIFSMMGLQIVNPTAVRYFEQLLHQSLKARLDGFVTRNDFQQALVEAQKLDKNSEILTNKIMIANSVVFFLAGAQATSAFIGFVIYELAGNQNIQEKLRRECTTVVKSDGTFDYDELCGLNYLEMVCNEILRLYPGAVRLEREAETDYVDDETGLWVPKGTTVVIPVNAVHRDPKYYPNPNVFDPEHFSTEKKQERSPYAFMPFGIGPRNCIGMRFALIESKALVAKLVTEFRIVPGTNTPFPVQSIPAGLQVFPPNNLSVKLIKL